MNALGRAVRSPPQSVLLPLIVLAFGIAAGYFFSPSHSHTWAFVYAVVGPACSAGLCIGLLRWRPIHARWLVPLLLMGVMLTVTTPPHALRVTAVGIAAGAFAIFASVRRYEHAAIASTLLCC